MLTKHISILRNVCSEDFLLIFLHLLSDSDSQTVSSYKQLQAVAYFGSLDTLSGLLPLGKWLL